MAIANLIYFPLERYKNRYTDYLSGIGGMFLSKAKQFEGLNVITLETLYSDQTEESVGVVVDPIRRHKHCSAQIEMYLQLTSDGVFTPDNTAVYFEDFWTPGIETILYAENLRGKTLPKFAFCHAQSVDKDDFTYSMLPWIRHFELGISEAMSGVFVAHKTLKELLVRERVCPTSKVHTVGTIMDRQIYYDRFFDGYSPEDNMTRDRSVIYSSRLQPEKNPGFFADVAEQLKLANYSFEFWSGKSTFDIEETAILKSFEEAGIKLQLNKTKEAYFKRLASAAVEFNCSSQDYIGYAQLDALSYGCKILVPNWRSFPSLTRNNPDMMYPPWNVDVACQQLQALVASQFGTPAYLYGSQQETFHYSNHFEKSVNRLLYNIAQTTGLPVWDKIANQAILLGV